LRRKAAEQLVVTVSGAWVVVGCFDQFVWDVFGIAGGENQWNEFVILGRLLLFLRSAADRSRCRRPGRTAIPAPGCGTIAASLRAATPRAGRCGNPPHRRGAARTGSIPDPCAPGCRGCS